MMHTGKILREYLRSNKITISEFAKIINRSESATYKILSGESSISTALLHEISMKLKHNFFYDIGANISIE